jgi:hypothetical protein
MLLISLVATQSLVEVEKETKIVANLKSNKDTCPLTGRKTFGAALTAIVESGGARFVRVARSGPRHQAVIFKKGPDSVESLFGASDDDLAGRLITTIMLFLPREGFFEEDKK